MKIPADLEAWNRLGDGHLPELLGIEFLAVGRDEVRARMELHRRLLAPNGFLHAAAVIGLADTACGYATVANLPAGASGFTTLELKSNFLGTARSGVALCVARPLHRGRSTQVWDAEVVTADEERSLAHFRCTQMILWPKG